jgi:hypothetical protein
MRPEGSRQVHCDWFCQGKMPILHQLSHLYNFIYFLELAMLRHVHGVPVQTLLSFHNELYPHVPIMPMVSNPKQVDRWSLFDVPLLVGASVI